MFIDRTDHSTNRTNRYTNNIIITCNAILPNQYIYNRIYGKLRSQSHLMQTCETKSGYKTKIDAYMYSPLITSNIHSSND